MRAVIQVSLYQGNLLGGSPSRFTAKCSGLFADILRVLYYATLLQIAGVLGILLTWYYYYYSSYSIR
jgi:hypothetical protein